MHPLIETFLILLGIFAAFMVIAAVAGLTMTILATQLVKKKLAETERKIQELLPQKDCGSCGAVGCTEHARALADGTSTSVGCPFIDEETSMRIRELLPVPIDESADRQIIERPRRFYHCFLKKRLQNRKKPDPSDPDRYI